MRTGRPSRTAERVAIRRAAHQLFDRPLVFEDPVALAILDADGREAAARRDRGMGGVFDAFLRAFLVARSRIAEDALAQAYAGGVRQYVLLGAGLDTFAYRNPWPDLRVFEVDHPATQAWKRERVAEGGISVPETLRYVPVDFEHQSLRDELAAAGWDPAAPTFFAWLGVTIYLTRDAIDTTLGLVASCPPGSGIAFDYTVPADALSLVERAALAMVQRRVAAVGEPWVSYFRPEELAAHLRGLGFARLEDSGGEAMNARFFSGAAGGLRTGRSARVMVAWV